MEEHTSKRAFGGRLGAARKGSSVALRDASNYKDGGVQCCNRLGCSTRFTSMTSSQVGNPDMSKNSKPSFRTTSSKSMIGSSSKRYSAVRDLKKPHQVSKKAPSAETNKIQVETEVSKGTSTVHIQTGLPEPEDVKHGILTKSLADESEKVESYKATPNENRGSSADESQEVESNRAIRNAKIQKQINTKSELRNQDILRSSRRPFAYKNSSQAVKSATNAQATNASRHGLRNLGCRSVSDVFPTRTSSHLSRSRKAEATNSSLDGDFSGRGRSSRSSSRESSGTGFFHSNFHSERQSSQQTSRTGIRPSSKDAVASVRTRTANGGNRVGISGRGKANSQIPAEATSAVPETTQTELSTSGSSAPFPSHLSHEGLATMHQNSFGRPSGGNGNGRNRLTAHVDYGLSVDQDDFRRPNIDDIDEVLFALEMIEQDQELTHEQLFFLDSNLILAGLGFHDQHRDMRLDIDNMSYEELLALEEKMGTVSTALTEEALSNCVKKSCYMSAATVVGASSCGDVDVKCSICQEEYAEGDELGKLGCDHLYHIACILQWLRQKNWCPICKSPAAAS